MQVETITAAVKKYSFGQAVNCYVLSAGSSAKHVVVVDPGTSIEPIRAKVGERTIDAIILTHRHIDHTYALEDLRDVWETGGAPVYVHELEKESVVKELRRHDEEPLATDIEPALVGVQHDDVLEIAGITLTVMLTAGHSAGSMCLYSEQDNVLLSGDTLFKMTSGRTDLASGSHGQMRSSLRLLATLPDETIVYPGHGPSTTIAFERDHAFKEYGWFF